MYSSVFFLAGVGILNLILSFFVIIRDIKSNINITFSLAIVAVAGWAFGLAFFISSDNYDVAIIAGKLFYIAPLFIALFLLEFSIYFTLSQNNFILKKINLILIAVPLILSFLILFIPNFLIKDVLYLSSGKEIQLGILEYLVYSVYFTSCLCSTVFILYKKYKTSSGLNKLQLLYLTLSLLVASVFGIFFNLILPWLGNYQLIWIGPQFTIIFIAAISYTIVKYKLFDIRILFGRIAYYIILAFIVVIFYYLFYVVDINLFSNSYNIGALIIGIPEALLFILFFNNFNKFLQNKIESSFINPDYDPKEVISSFNDKISTVLDYEDIIDFLLTNLAKTIRAQFELLVLVDKDDIKEIVKGKREISIDTETITKILNVFKEVFKYPLIIDELEFEIPPKFYQIKEQIKSLIIVLKNKGIKLVVPLSQQDQITGILIIGAKEAENPFNSIEVEFITSMAELTALALARAFLYKEVQEFSNTLQLKVDEATQQIQDKNKKLEESLHFERDMLDILGHELRTPLGTARNAILLLQMQAKAGKLSPEFINKEINIAVDNIRREVQLLETILASTKIDNNKLDLKMEQVDAYEVIEASIQGNIQDAEKKKLKLYFVEPKKKMYCYTDRLRIQQIMDNLTSNAVKYTKEGEIEITLKEKDDQIVFAIKDTGEGIAKDEIPNLGKKFYRINNYLPSQGTIGDRKIVRPGGTGIGLYVVFQLIKAMGGEIVVESDLGKGTTFSFNLPKYINQTIMA